MRGPPVGRRAALGAGLLAASAGTALAQSTIQIPGRYTPPPPGAPRPPDPRQPAAGPAAPGVVLPPPLPCADRRGDLVALTLEGPCPAGVVVFGQAFIAGQLPREAGLTARLQPGGAIPAQLDALAFHPDGTVRHALVSLRLPRLGPGERRGAVLSRGEGAAPAPLDLEAALRGREAVVELAPRDGGAPWRADLLVLWRALGGRPWQFGPLAVQGRVALRVPPEAAGGVRSLRLVADIAVRADETLWVDLWLRNDIAQQPDGGAASYRVRLLLDGRDALDAHIPRHPQYTAWGRLRGARRGEARPPETAFVRHDVGYLSRAHAVMPYDLSTGVLESLLAEMARLTERPDWNDPFNPRGLQTNMGAGGARPDLGQTTNWQAAWLLSGDRRAAAVALGQAEAAGNIPWHFWDMNGGAEGQGGWLDVRRWPGFWTDPRGGRPPRGLLQPVPGREQTGWAPQTSHAPALSYTPYLLTGRRAFLDNLTAQAAWNISGIWPAARHVQASPWASPTGRPPSAAPAEDVLVAYGQPRSGAWALRTIGEAVWIAPPDDPNLPYLRDVELRNWAWLRRMIPEWTEIQGELHGYLVGYGFGRGAQMTFFQQEYVASTAALAAERGIEDARVFLDWMRNFIVGRFFAEAKGFPRVDGIAYEIAITEGPPPAWNEPPRRVLTTWAEVARVNRARNWGNSNQGGWRASDGEYGRLAMLSLAQVYNVLGDRRALEAWDWLARSGAPYTSVNDFARVPAHNVVPRGRVRVPERAPACTRERS